MSIPEEVQNYINSLSVEITEINLDFKNLTILPDLSRFINLKILHCFDNQLTSIPVMNSLEILVCDDNKLTTIPVMNNLESLSCGNNDLTSIPVMNNLKILFCDENKLTSIPVMGNLKELYCGYNQLTTIPLMNNLQILYCNNNPINDLIENSIDKLKILNKFKELFYTLKCKKRLRNFYYDKVIRPKIEFKYHPDKLIELIEGQEDYEGILETW